MFIIDKQFDVLDHMTKMDYNVGQVSWKPEPACAQTHVALAKRTEYKGRSMAVQDLLIMGNPKLWQHSQAVESIKDYAISRIIEDMQDSMAYFGGVGIAAPQIGYFYRIILFGFDYSARYPQAESIPKTILINPELECLDSTIEHDWEGCLSVPDIRAVVPRYRGVRYRGYNENGHYRQKDVYGFHARVVQHELDHVNGILFPQRVTDFTTFGFESELFA